MLMAAADRFLSRMWFKLGRQWIPILALPGDFRSALLDQTSPDQGKDPKDLGGIVECVSND